MVKWGSGMTNRFDADTALARQGDGAFAGRIDRGWWVERGPNGGYIAALILRALTMAVEDQHRDAAREPRSLTVQYLAPPAEGPARVATTVERAGRSLTMLSARLLQEDQPLALALATFAAPRSGVAFAEAAMPAAPPPEECPPFPPPGAALAPINARYEYRLAIGAPPFSGGAQARAGGWLRLAEPRPVDYPLAAAFTDAWAPAVFSRLPGPVGVPTIDLTIHFRARLPRPGARADDFHLAVFQTRLATEGFIEEDGEIWSRDGTLIAQSRQLALLPAER